MTSFGGPKGADLLFDNSYNNPTTWEWNGVDWAQITTLALPEDRYHTSMAAFEASASSPIDVVLFGGITHTTDVLASDTWAFEVPGNIPTSGPSALPGTWTQQNPSANPGGATGHEGGASAYDSADHEVVAFGGFNGSSGVTGDTWTWDGTTWTDHPAVAGTTPPARAGAVMATDPSGHVVMFGGNDGASNLNDTWTWSAGTWTKDTTGTPPPARTDAAMALLNGSGTDVLFGGSELSTNNYFGDTWAWDGSTWTQVTTSGTPPLARADEGLAYDSITGKLVMYAGAYYDTTSSSIVTLQDTWTYSSGTWTPVTTGVNTPDALQNMAMVSDPADGGGVLLFGGLSSTTVEGKTWHWDGTGWSQPSSTTAAGATVPPARFNAFAAEDVGRAQVVLSDGLSSSYADLSDTWTWADPPLTSHAMPAYVQGAAAPKVTSTPNISSVGSFAQFALPQANSDPGGIAAAPDGSLWVAEPTSGNLAHVSASGAVTEVATTITSPFGVAAGRDGTVWVAGRDGQLAELAPGGGAPTVFSTTPVNNASALPTSIAVAGDGTAWFTEQAGGKIGKVAPGAGSVVEYAVPSGIAAFPSGIAIAGDGSVWFTEPGVDKIGEYTPGTSLFAEYPLPTADAGPAGIVAGPDGNLWFTEFIADQVGSITPGGTVTEHPLPTGGASPLGIASASDALWFAEKSANALGRITTIGSISEFTLDTASSNPAAVAVVGDTPWVTETSPSRVAEALAPVTGGAPVIGGGGGGGTGPSCPSGATSCQSATSSAPGGSSTATNVGTTVAASDGEGTITVSQYPSDPVGKPSFSSTGEFFDVELSSGNTFTSVTVTDTNLNGGTGLDWWNGSAWQTVVGDPGPTYSSGPPAAISLTLDSTTSPSLTQLTGTVFGVAATPPPPSTSPTTTPTLLPGYRLVGADGGVFDFGSASFHGSAAGRSLAAPIVGTATTPDGGGYWLVGRDGSVYPYGDARYFGQVSAVHLAAPIVGMVATPDGGGYWLVGSDGGVFSFGDAAFHGSAGAIHLAAPIVGMVATPDGGGYWLVGSDGGVFSFGDAAFHGSAGAIHLAAPVVGMAATPDGGGYWLVGSDGGVFSFGDAAFRGSAGAVHLAAPITSVGAGW